MTPAKTYFDGKRSSSLSYLFKADRAADIRIDVITAKGGEVVDSIVKRHQKPFSNYTASWDGLLENGRIAPNGDYRFKVSQLSGGGGAGAKFSFYDHIFPLRGKHKYGDGLGVRPWSRRPGRLREVRNQDRRRPWRASSSRRLSVRGRLLRSHRRCQERATTTSTPTCSEPAARPRAHASAPGQVIGFESDTGRASGCHMHFELWSSPGWYEGGHVLNPTKPLKAWDKYS